MESTSYKNKAMKLISSRLHRTKKSETSNVDIGYGNQPGGNCKNDSGDASRILVLTVNSYTFSKLRKKGRYTYICLLQAHCNLVGGKPMRVSVDLDIKLSPNASIMQVSQRLTSSNISLRISDLKYLYRDFGELIFHENSPALLHLQAMIDGRKSIQRYQLPLL